VISAEPRCFAPVKDTRVLDCTPQGVRLCNRRDLTFTEDDELWLTVEVRSAVVLRTVRENKKSRGKFEVGQEIVGGQRGRHGNRH